MKIESLENKIIHDDCMDLMKSLPDKSIDLVLTDPPYGYNIMSRLVKIDGEVKCFVGGGAKGHLFSKKYWDDAPPGKEVFEEIFRVSKNQIIWGGNYFALGRPSRCWLVWDKGEQMYGRNFAEAELAFTSFNRNTLIFKQAPFMTQGRIHPTQKPLSLFKWSLSNFSKPGDLILDCFSGSGTTAVACHELGRRFICVEKDEEYYNASVKRLKEAQRQGLLNLSDIQPCQEDAQEALAL